jgi:hypothetical protein
MKICEGAYYRTRGGDVVGPLSAVSWCDRTFSALDLTWHEDGSYVQGVPGNLDLISEVYVIDTLPADGANNFQNCTVGTYAPETKTLRDDFAMAALQGMLAAECDLARNIARCAYEYADAMMEARKK